MEPHGTCLEERNNIKNKPQVCATCQHLKKKFSNHHNDRQHKDEGAIDGDQLRITHPWMLSMDKPRPKKTIYIIRPLTMRWSNPEFLHGWLDVWKSVYIYMYVCMYRRLNYTWINPTKNSPRIPHNYTTTHCSYYVEETSQTSLHVLHFLR